MNEPSTTYYGHMHTYILCWFFLEFYIRIYIAYTFVLKSYMLKSIIGIKYSVKISIAVSVKLGGCRNCCPHGGVLPRLCHVIVD